MSGISLTLRATQKICWDPKRTERRWEVLWRVPLLGRGKVSDASLGRCPVSEVWASLPAARAVTDERTEAGGQASLTAQLQQQSHLPEPGFPLWGNKRRGRLREAERASAGPGSDGMLGIMNRSAGACPSLLLLRPTP